MRTVGLLLCLFSSVVHAKELADKLSVHGYLAQGVVQAQDSNFINDDGDVSLRQTEIGINATYRLRPSMRLTGQLAYINGGNRYPEGLRLDYLFWDISLVNTLDWRVNLYLGRNKNHHWLYSVDRTVPQIRPTIIPPQSVYFDVFRDVALSSDGISLMAQTGNRLGDWQIQWSLGESQIDRQQMLNLLSPDAKGSLDQKYDHQFSVNYRPVESAWELGVLLLDSKFDYGAGEGDSLSNGDVRTSRLQFSLRYNAENWEFASELMKERVVFEDVLFPGFSNKAIAEGGYLQWRYFLNHNMTLLARVDVFDRDREFRNGENIVALSEGVIPAYFGFMDTATLGGTWKFASDWQLKAEYHRVKGTGRLAPVLIADVGNNDHKYWDIWALEVAYWF